MMIATSTHEQHEVVSEISKNVSNILDAANTAAADSEVTASAAGDLKIMSEELMVLSEKFESR